uniref:Uncharacterized protein n=1 Tax=Arundo donax TaxID=35708 RepID=A0A0A8ZUK3_ARUDO
MCLHFGPRMLLQGQCNFLCPINVTRENEYLLISVKLSTNHNF